MTSRRILDDLSGYDFEEIMMDVYRKLGYEYIRNPGRSGDEGRDILMEKNGTNYVVECKHIQKVSRPMIQKLDSAVSTYSEDAVGILVTTGKFTKQARDYAEKVNNGETNLRLTNGEDLREKGEKVGLDLYSGKIEVLCNEVVDLPTRREKAEEKIENKFHHVKNFHKDYIDSIDIDVELVPALHIEARTEASFETSVGKIYGVNEKDEVTVKAGRSGSNFSCNVLPEIIPDSVKDSSATVELDEEKFSETFDSFDIKRYEKTETDYKDEIKQEIKDKHEAKVKYTGDNNVTYEKICRPKNSDINIENITPLYVPLVKSNIDIQNYKYQENFYTSPHQDIIKKDEIHKCVYCGRGHTLGLNLTFCENCGSINCMLHKRTERLEKQPICAGCSVTERFFLRKKHFYNQENLREFQKKYREMPNYKKILENKPMIAALVIAAISLFAAII